MGKKGAKGTPEGAAAAAALVAELGAMGDVRSRKMFGGHGVFCDGVMFALVDSEGGCFLRASEATAADFERAGSGPHGKMPYWRIPAGVRADPAALDEWASRALGIARAAAR